MKNSLKVFFVMLVVPIAYAGLSRFFAVPLALWGSVLAAGLVGISWFHRARSKGHYIPYLILWGLLFGAMYTISGSSYCEPGGMAANLSALFCPFPK